jgi:hypothetical protein
MADANWFYPLPDASVPEPAGPVCYICGVTVLGLTWESCASEAHFCAPQRKRKQSVRAQLAAAQLAAEGDGAEDSADLRGTSAAKVCFCLKKNPHGSGLTASFLQISQFLCVLEVP